MPEPQVAKAPVPPIASDEFVLSAPDEVLGRLQVVRARHEDTFPDLARRYNLGYDELRLANSTVDPWVPGEGTSVLLPTQFILPDTPRQGVVLNLAAMRLFYFPDTGQSEVPRVLTHPVGIGRLEWPTPTGSTAVVSKARDPVWYVPRSIRREHAAAGDPLPSQVPPGPDNPLGEYVLQLGMPGYLIHGTNKPYGVGMRVSHGCVRLYPEDIEPLFRMVPIGTPVHIVNQPYLAGWLAGTLYLEAHEPMAGDEREWGTHLEPLLAATLGGRPVYRAAWGRGCESSPYASTSDGAHWQPLSECLRA